MSGCGDDDGDEASEDLEVRCQRPGLAGELERHLGSLGSVLCSKGGGNEKERKLSRLALFLAFRKQVSVAVRRSLVGEPADLLPQSYRCVIRVVSNAWARFGAFLIASLCKEELVTPGILGISPSTEPNPPLQLTVPNSELRY